VRDGSYAKLFLKVWGAHAFDDAEKAYDCVSRSLAAYERSRKVSRFASPYDTYLRAGRGLNAQERLGLSLFKRKAGCADCHVTRRDKAAGGVVFTDYTYANLGIPKNPVNPFYQQIGSNPAGASWIDLGLGDFLASTAGATPDYSAHAAENMGKFRVPTLRNVDKRPHPGFVKAYGHNGYFKSLRQVVHFHNTRDVPGAGWKGEPWPAPEYAANLETTETGHLRLTTAQEKAIVAFLRTLTDR
jgi:cytochrome c peroxidase